MGIDGEEKAPESAPFNPVPETPTGENDKSEIVISFPKGVHTTELVISYVNVDINQMLLASDHVLLQRNQQLKIFEDMAKQPVRERVGQLFDPRRSDSPANAAIIDLKKR